MASGAGDQPGDGGNRGESLTAVLEAALHHGDLMGLAVPFAHQPGADQIAPAVDSGSACPHAPRNAIARIHAATFFIVGLLISGRTP